MVITGQYHKRGWIWLSFQTTEGESTPGTWDGLTILDGEDVIVLGGTIGRGTNRWWT